MLGGIASGKSSVARLLAGPLGLVLDADAMVAQLYEDPGLCDRIAQALGPSILNAKGLIDRPALALSVFSNPAARQLVESWIHPLVRQKLRSGLEAARAAGVPRVVLDVPLLLENESEHLLPAECETLIFVDAPLEQRDARAVVSRGWKSGEVARRESLQLPLESKRARAQYVLRNNGDPAQLTSAVASLLQELDPPQR